MSKSAWLDASRLILETSEGQKNRTVLSEICERISQSALSKMLEVDASWRPNQIYIRSLDERHKTKVLELRAIQGDKVEISIKDSATNMDRYFFPHTPSSEALERGLHIIKNLDWSREVKQYRNPLDYIFKMLGITTAV